MSDQKIFHNLIYRNTQYGSWTQVLQMSAFFQYVLCGHGDNIRIQNSASNTEVRSNILWADEGYDIYVGNNSQAGFYSDYNTLWTTGDGKVGYWTKDFTDILDWQADVAQFDLHSIGRTIIDPAWAAARNSDANLYWAEPAFLNKALDDYRIFELVGGQRFSSPTIDAADPRTDQGTTALNQNLLLNPDFEDGLNSWTTNATQGQRPQPPQRLKASSISLQARSRKALRSRP